MRSRGTVRGEETAVAVWRRKRETRCLDEQVRRCWTVAEVGERRGRTSPFSKSGYSFQFTLLNGVTSIFDTDSIFIQNENEQKLNDWPPLTGKVHVIFFWKLVVVRYVVRVIFFVKIFAVDKIQGFRRRYFLFVEQGEFVG